MSIILTRLFQISKKICIPKISISDIRNKNFAIIIIINDSIYPAVSKAARTGNKRSVVSRTIVQTDESLGAA